MTVYAPQNPLLPVDYIANGGFETGGLAPFTAFNPLTCQVVNIPGSQHSGTYFCLVNTAGNGIYLSLTINRVLTSFGFWYAGALAGQPLCSYQIDYSDHASTVVQNLQRVGFYSYIDLTAVIASPNVTKITVTEAGAIELYLDDFICRHTESSSLFYPPQNPR